MCINKEVLSLISLKRWCLKCSFKVIKTLNFIYLTFYKGQGRYHIDIESAYRSN